MDSNPTEQRKVKKGGILKTSTWGGLIAFPLVLVVLGLKGHLSDVQEKVLALRPATWPEFCPPKRPCLRMLTSCTGRWARLAMF